MKPLLVRFLLPVFLVFLGLGCGGGLPDDPAERSALLRDRILNEESAVKAGYWMALIGDDVSPEMRDFLFERLEEGHHMVAMGSVNVLSRASWLGDPEVRRRLAAYYADPMGSQRRREAIGRLIITPHRDAFPEFAGLPDGVRLPRGAARIGSLAQGAEP